MVNFDSRLINHDVVKLDRATVGAAETVLLALQARANNKDTSMLLVDCDAIYHSDIITRFRALESQTEVRAAVLSFVEEEPERDAKPKYSYVNVDANGDIIQVAEKVRVGPLANTGAYWFASTHEFMELADSIIKNKHFSMGEAYISCVVDEYLKREKKAKAVVIKADEYSNVGTPECLERYLSSKAGRAFLFDLDGTLVNTTDAYVRAWSSILAPKGAFVDAQLFNTHISGLSDDQVRHNFKIAIASDEKDKEFLKHIDLVNEIPGAETSASVTTRRVAWARAASACLTAPRWTYGRAKRARLGNTKMWLRRGWVTRKCG